MTRTRANTLLVAFAAVFVAGLVLHAQRRDVFVQSRNHPAIAYDKGPVDNPVSRLNQRLEAGDVHMDFDQVTGYLRPVLDALNIPIESQVLVFSQTSFQAPLINAKNPRAVFFNDTTAVGWVRGGQVLEIAVQDPRQGAVFYTVDQGNRERAHFTRNE